MDDLNPQSSAAPAADALAAVSPAPADAPSTGTEPGVAPTAPGQEPAWYVERFGEMTTRNKALQEQLSQYGPFDPLIQQARAAGITDAAGLGSYLNQRLEEELARRVAAQQNPYDPYRPAQPATPQPAYAPPAPATPPNVTALEQQVAEMRQAQFRRDQCDAYGIKRGSHEDQLIWAQFSHLAGTMPDSVPNEQVFQQAVQFVRSYRAADPGVHPAQAAPAQPPAAMPAIGVAGATPATPPPWSNFKTQDQLTAWQKEQIAKIEIESPNAPPDDVLSRA